MHIMEKTKVTVEALIDAPKEKVWQYFTEPEHITQWNFADDSWQCPRAENDLRVGGKYSARMEAKDGSFGFDFDAIYDEVREGESITYTMGDGRQSTTDFTDVEGKTMVTTAFDAETMNDIEMQRGGWQAILNNFKKHAESQS
jgi:uncharacterized protein YndB with AHSA1/START domain